MQVGPEGFAANVTGCGTSPSNTCGVSSLGDLKDALDVAKANKGTLIRFDEDIEGSGDLLDVEAEDCTIEGGGHTLTGAGFNVDCKASDNVIIRGLRFEPDSGDKPRDAIWLLYRDAKMSTGVWITRCTFEPFYDMAIQTQGDDNAGDRCLVSISQCRFDGEPSNSDNQGSINLSGPGKDGFLYATVYDNWFKSPRRRSPRASAGVFIDAFNNVVDDWGEQDDEQSNGMKVEDAELAALANWMDPGKGVKGPSIDIEDGGAAYYPDQDEPLHNVWDEKENEPNKGSQDVGRDAKYTDLGLDLEPPAPTPMTPELADTIRGTAGAPPDC